MFTLWTMALFLNELVSPFIVQQSYSIGFQLLYVNLSENFGLIETKLTLFDCTSLQRYSK